LLEDGSFLISNPESCPTGNHDIPVIEGVKGAV
jgi:hypothetical protein